MPPGKTNPEESQVVPVEIAAPDQAPILKQVGNIFTGTCQQCGKEFSKPKKNLGAGRFCTAKCGHLFKRGKKQRRDWVDKRIQKGEKHWNYKGKNITQDGGRSRARRLYPKIGVCEVCGKLKTERHHVNGDTRDNSPENIQILCRSHHAEAECVIRNIRRDTQKELHEQLIAPLPDEAITPIASKPGMYGVNVAYVIDRLNSVFGVDGWRANFTVIEQGPMIVTRCDLIMRYGKMKIERHAFGGNANEDRGDAFKGSCTDSLTKAASAVGIAQAVYMGRYNKPSPSAPQPSRTAPNYEPEPEVSHRDAHKKLAKFQIEGLLKAMAKTGKTDAQVNEFLQRECNITSISQMTRGVFEFVINWVNWDGKSDPRKVESIDAGRQKQPTPVPTPAPDEGPRQKGLFQ